MGGRDPHFEDPMLWNRDIRKTKYDLCFFYHLLRICGTLSLIIFISELEITALIVVVK